MEAGVTLEICSEISLTTVEQKDWRRVLRFNLDRDAVGTETIRLGIPVHAGNTPLAVVRQSFTGHQEHLGTS